MIKGINRSIIEVNDTGSVYYERAILVIKPEFASVQREVLEKEAKKILGEMGAPSSLNKGKTKARNIIIPILSAVAGAVITILCFML